MDDISKREIKENDDNSDTSSTSSEAISMNVDEDRGSSRISFVEESSFAENSELNISEATDVANHFGKVTKKYVKSENTQETPKSANIDFTSFTRDQTNNDTLVENIAKLFANIKIPGTETSNNKTSETANISNIEERRENAPEVFVFNAERTESSTNKNKRLLKVEPSTSTCSTKPANIPELVTLPGDVLPYVQGEVSNQVVPVHTFLATIDAVLLILEGTLSGAYRISQNYAGPQIPLVIENAMQSIRLSMETLRNQFSNTDPACFEPLASILRELLTPALNLFGDICPELACYSTDFYHAVDVPKPEPIPEEQASCPEFAFRPRIFYPKLRVFATHDGFIRIILPYTFEIDITIDGAICLKNLKDRTIAAISECGNYTGIASDLCRVHHYGQVLEARITDVFSQKNMYGKIGVRGIFFGGTGTPESKNLTLNGETVAAPITFSELDNDFISEIFLSHSTHGPANFEACRTVLQNSTEKTLTDGSVHFCCQDIKITQYKNGEVLVNRNKGALLIWCSPEILHPDPRAERKGFIKVVTPVCRVISTIISNPVLAHETFFLGNLRSQWLYYNTVEFLASNEGHSAGYKDIAEEEEEPTEERQNDPNQ